MLSFCYTHTHLKHSHSLLQNPSLNAAHDAAQKALEAANQQQKSRCESNCIYASWIVCCVPASPSFCVCNTLYGIVFVLFAVPQMPTPPFSQPPVLPSGGKPSLSTVTTVSPPVLTQQQVPPQQPQQQPQVPPPGPPSLNQQPPQAPQQQPNNQQTPPPTQPGMVRLEKCISVDIVSCFISILTLPHALPFQYIFLFQTAVPAPPAGAQQGVANKIVAWSGVLEWQEVRSLYQ